jgi:hypothetical protein
MPTKDLLISRKLKCFVAMAFERTDTDAIYGRSIEPCLNKLSVKPIRVDRIEHNDDIDDKILEELEDCALAVVDLTYARPSVYFEAGYAQRKVPVIYTARKDHFRPKPDDEFGTFRVHFDLQMRNIIGWRSPSDKSFPKRLFSRIRYVIRPLLKDRKRSESISKEMTEFGALSPRDKAQAIKQTVASALSSAGYKARKRDSEDSNTSYRERGEDSAAWTGRAKNSSNPNRFHNSSPR